MAALTAALAPLKPWRRRAAGLAAAMLGLAAVAWLAVVVLRVDTANGTLVVEMDNADVEARIKNGKLILEGPDGKVRYTLAPSERNKQLEAGPYTIHVEGADGLVLDTPEFTLKKGGEVKVRVTLERKAVAKKETQKKDEATVVLSPTAILEALRRDKIPQEVLALAGDGDANRAPASLVGFLGEAKPFHTEAVLGLAYSPDGRWLATGSVDKTIMLRDAATGDVKRTLKGHTGAVTAVVFSKDSKSLLSCSHDGTIKVWSVDKEEVPKTLRPEFGQILTMAGSPDGRFLAAGGADRPIKLWKWGEWDKSTDLELLKGRVTSLTFSPDGSILASSWDGSVRLYQTADGKTTQTWPFDTSNRMLAFHRDGKRLVSTDEWIKTWDVASGKKIAQSVNEATGCHLIALRPDGEIVYICFAGGEFAYTLELTTLRRSTEKEFKFFRAPHGICSAVYSPNGQFLARGTNNGGVHVWDFSKGDIQFPKQGHSHYITTLSVHPDGRMVLSGGDDNGVYRWDVSRPGESKPLL